MQISMILPLLHVTASKTLIINRQINKSHIYVHNYNIVRLPVIPANQLLQSMMYITTILNQAGGTSENQVMLIIRYDN